MEESVAIMDKLPTPKIPSRSSEKNDLTMDVTAGIGCQVKNRFFQKSFTPADKMINFLST